MYMYSETHFRYKDPNKFKVIDRYRYRYRYRYNHKQYQKRAWVTMQIWTKRELEWLCKPTCISVPAGIVVRGCVQLEWIVFEDSMYLRISWWVIYKQTWLHCPECSAVFDQKHVAPCPTLPIHLISPQETFFPGWKKSSQREMFCQCGRRETKNGISIKRHQNWWIQNCFVQWKKNLDRCIASNGEYFEGDWSLNM